MKRVMLIFVLGLVTLTVPQEQAGTVYDASTDFSATSNPNGVRSYGWSLTLGSAFNVDTTNQISDGLNFWEGPFMTEEPNGHALRASLFLATEEPKGHALRASLFLVGEDVYRLNPFIVRPFGPSGNA